MRHIMSKLLLTAGAAGMAFAPIAASANTRANDNTRASENAPVFVSGGSVEPGLGRDAEGEGVVGVPIGLLFAAAAATAAVIATVVVVTDDENNDPAPDPDQSPGT
ncbi:hypothetical protein [Erythrobacter sp.]|jgi:hypothetical protein|uniref:hypothetical protein n=1 Tax=Erythrobacter sp. TaxID=1042 RepID=UPI002EBBCBD0|nr:hypothetical protein [Erythrobacter sp.]